MNEKGRILIIAFVLFIIFIIVAVIDGWFTIPVFSEGHGGVGWHKLPYWLIAMGILLSIIGFGLGFASLLGDWGQWSREDYLAVLLLTIQSWILILGGFLDIISYTVQNHVSGLPLTQWRGADGGVWTSFGQRWTWLDPSRTYGVPIFCNLFSRALGYEGTVTIGVIMGSVFSIALIASFWGLYYKYA